MLWLDSAVRVNANADGIKAALCRGMLFGFDLVFWLALSAAAISMALATPV